MNEEKTRNTNKPMNIRCNDDNKRTDRVKKAEKKRMLKLHEAGKSNEEIASLSGRNVRTVSKHLAEARAYQQRNARMIDPLIIEAKRKHFTDMAAIVSALLANGLDTVRKHSSIEGTEKIIYSTLIGDSMEVLSHEQLGDRLRVNMGLKWVRMNAEDIDRFLAHLKADYHELEFRDILTIVAENPYELIEAIRLLIRRGTLKGECDICEHLW
ncbi:MAG: hypothetical protein JXB43_09710 [Dehalococcoidia bacterium]|nr:hypothetical protein [Dehalococcoidia bacterium]